VAENDAGFFGTGAQSIGEYTIYEADVVTAEGCLAANVERERGSGGGETNHERVAGSGQGSITAWLGDMDTKCGKDLASG